MASRENAKRRLTILGSTGSIGTNTLDVVERLGGRDSFEIVALTETATFRCWRSRRLSTAQSLPLPPTTAITPA